MASTISGTSGSSLAGNSAAAGNFSVGGGLAVTGTLNSGAITSTGAISGTTGSFNGDMSFNSGYGSAAVAYGCRAWVKFVGATGVITASGNVSSVVRNSAGNYTINFATPMPDANYAVNVTAANQSGTGQTVGQLIGTAPTTSSVVVYCATNGVGAADPVGTLASMFVTIHR